MGWGKQPQTATIEEVKKGCNYNPDITALTVDESPNAMNVEIYRGRWRKRFGYSALASSVGSTAIGYSVKDFGSVSGQHKQIMHFGTNVYAMTTLGGALTTIRSGAPAIRSFNARVGSFMVQSYNDYTAPYYWDGVAGSMSLLSASAPGFKQAIEFQGFLLWMNVFGAPMRVGYQLTSSMVNGAYSDYFTLAPAPNDDEITGAFILYGRLYITSKYSVFRVTFVGGVTVFQYQQVLFDVGAIPNTIKVVVTQEYGQVALFLGYDRRVYLFDGANVKTISESYYQHNKDTEISLDLIDDAHKENSFAIFDPTMRVYRLFVTKRGEATNRYCLNIDVDSFAYYPYSNMTMSAGDVAADANNKAIVVSAGYTGVLYQMFCGENTDDGSAIDDYWESALISVKDGVMKQGQSITIFMKPVSNSKVAVSDKVDFARGWQLRREIPLCSSRDRILGQSFMLGSSAVLGSDHDILMQTIASPVAFNTYRVRMTSNQATTPRWEMLKLVFDQSILTVGKAEPQR